MIVTTTSIIEGHPVQEYLGIVAGEAVLGLNVFKDFGAGIRNLVGGRSAGYEDEIIKGREQATHEMMQRAQALGANAVVGVDIDYESVGTANGGMIMVTVAGTAVIAG